MPTADPFDPDAEQPWLWAEGDSDNSYGAFCAYRDLGPRRSISKTVPIVYGEGATGSVPKVAQLKKWSRQLDWVERAAAYDRYEDHLKRLAHQDAVEEMQRRQADQGVELAMRAIGDLLQKENLAPQDAIRALALGVKMERDARGVAERIELGGEVNVTHGSDLARTILADPEARDLSMALLRRIPIDDRRSGQPDAPGAPDRPTED